MPAHPTVDLSTTSLIKLALHAAKYPASPVCGVLLGRVTGGDGEEGESAGAGAAPAAAAVRVVDAVPLLHSGLGLAPMPPSALGPALAAAWVELCGGAAEMAAGTGVSGVSVSLADAVVMNDGR